MGWRDWPQGATPLMSRPCEGCWYDPGSAATAAALDRELYLTCRRVPRAVCAGFYAAHTTAALRMIHLIWEFTTVDPPRERRRCHARERAGRR
jgi:hypothetical protein